MSSKKPILVTGSSRSGSTWVGRMLSTPSGIGYIHEPFNLNHRPGICSAKFKYSRTYVSSENEHLYYDHLKDTLSYKFKLFDGLKALRSPKDAALLLKDYALFSIYRKKNSRPLIKDPIASFSSEWLASRFDMDVLVLIRHPAAYALSIKEMNWRPPFLGFLKQPLLMKDHFGPYEEEIRRQTEKEHDIIDQAALYWKLIYHVFEKYRMGHPEWLFVRHEDLSRDPIIVFQRIFSRFDIEFSEKVRKNIMIHSKSSNPIDGDSIKRYSKGNINKWKNRLSSSETERVRECVEDISKIYYSDEDWS